MLRSMAFAMLAILPGSLLAAESRGGMMYVNGSAWVNGSSVPRSFAIFPGDVVQTAPASLAKISVARSSISLFSDTKVNFGDNAISLHEGSLVIATANGMAVHAGELTVAPLQQTSSEFEMRESGDGVEIASHKGGLHISNGHETVTLPEGRTVRYASSDRKDGAAAPADPNLWDSPEVIGIGLLVVGGLAAWVLSRPSPPASPSKP